MNKSTMIELLFYLGYIVGFLVLSVAIFALLYLILVKLLDFKRIRGLLRDIILIKDIREMEELEYQNYLNSIEKLRRKK